MQRGRAERGLFALGGLARAFVELVQARGDYVELLVVNFAAQAFEPALVAALVRVHVCRAIQAVARLWKISHAEIEIKQFHQSLAVIVLAVRGIEKLAQKLEHLGRGPVRRGQILHGRDKRATLAFLALVGLELAGQGSGVCIEFGIEHGADQGDHLLDAAGFCSNSAQTKGSASASRFAASRACA